MPLPPPATSVNHMWSDAFCHGLSTLVTHSLWPVGPNFILANSLATAIQYVVILRTGDSRPWDPTFGSRDPFRAAFKKYSADGETPMRKVHEELREYMASHGVYFPSFSMSHLFLELEKLITSPTIPSAKQEQEYGVRTADLRILTRALDNMTHITGSKLLPAKVQYETAMACRSKDCLPSTRQELARYHEAAVIEEMRRRHNSRQSAGNASPAAHYQSSSEDGMQDLEIEASSAPSGDGDQTLPMASSILGDDPFMNTSTGGEALLDSSLNIEVEPIIEAAPVDGGTLIEPILPDEPFVPATPIIGANLYS